MFVIGNYISETEFKIFTDVKIILNFKNYKIVKIRKMPIKVHTDKKLSEKRKRSRRKALNVFQ